MKRSLIGTAALGLVIALSGCTGGASSQSSDSAPPASGNSGTEFAGPDSTSPELAGPEGSAENGSAGSGAADSGVRAEGSLDDPAAVDRQVVTTGSMTVTAEDPIDAAAEATAIVERAGGRVDARRETAPTDDDSGSAMLTVRVPSESLTETIDDLKALGKSQSVELDKVDVTTEAQDLAARIGAARASVDRLTALLATATDVEVLIKLETAISERQGSLEAMEAQQRYLSDQVSLSTIDLYLVSPQNAPAETPDTFWSGLVTGWTSFTGFIAFLLVAAGVLLPWLAVAGVLAVVALVAVKRMRRRRSGSGPAPVAPGSDG